MDDKASSPCIKTRGTHRFRHSKSMDNTSLNHSDIFTLMIGTYPSLHQVPGMIDNTTHTLLLRSHAPMPDTRQSKMHTDLISNSAICWCELGNATASDRQQSNSNSMIDWTDSMAWLTKMTQHKRLNTRAWNVLETSCDITECNKVSTN